MSAEAESNLRGVAPAFESADDGTLYWTLSIYFEEQAVAKAAGRGFEAQMARVLPKAVEAAMAKAKQIPAEPRLEPFQPDDFRRAQLLDPASSALRRAIDPLFNDIADRDRFGKVEDFLFAAERHAPSGATPNNPEDAIRSWTDVTFKLPPSFTWMTEGQTFLCSLASDDLGAEPIPSLNRVGRMRRFWLAHSNGALSYHLSFAYKFNTSRDAQTYYFLSLLQKLATPKEFSLNPARQEEIAKAPGAPDPRAPDACTVFRSDLGIDPLDGIHVSDDSTFSSSGLTFWNYVREKFFLDAESLFGTVLLNADTDWARLKSEERNARKSELLTSTLLELIEVPGLFVPRNRSLFFILDKQFFERLLPRREDGTRLPRKTMVRDSCYEPYRQQIKNAEGGGPPLKSGEKARVVRIGRDPGSPNEPHVSWPWLAKRPDYEALFRKRDAPQGEPVWLSKEQDRSVPICSWEDLVVGAHAGKCWQHGELRNIGGTDKIVPLSEGVRHHIPALDVHRADCLDYLFLAGFNQNIIDWLNQEPSEILDSTDPIYPTEESQLDEAFFVRFANHRAMITYVPKSRTLEVGNDYIGTCPYAFLIHALALNNEFLAREHERSTAREVEEVGELLSMLQTSESLDTRAGNEDDELWVAFAYLEGRINELKSNKYRLFERHRYSNIFRYDTEGAVFETLTKLRGIGRRDDALKEAIASLEDKSRDIEGRHAASRRRAEKRWREGEDERAKTLNVIVSLIGTTSVLGLLFNIADFVDEKTIAVDRIGRWFSSLPGSRHELAQVARAIGSTLILLVVLLVVLFALGSFAARAWRDRTRRP